MFCDLKMKTSVKVGFKFITQKLKSHKTISHGSKKKVLSTDTRRMVAEL